MERSTLDLWVGLFVCAGIGALLVLAMKVGNMASIGIGNDSYTLYAQFRQYRRAEAARAGEERGRGRRARRERSSSTTTRFNARVEMNDRRAVQVSEGHDRVDPDVGSARRAVHRARGGRRPANLATGETLKLTQSAVVLEKLISQFLYSKAAEGDSGAKK